MDAPQIIAESLQDLMDALNHGHRAVKAVEDAERERTAELHRQVESARRKAFESGRKAGYAQGVEDGRRLAPAERDSVYAAGFAEGAALAAEQRVRK